MIRAEIISGNTGCLFLTGNCIPFYCLSEKSWVLLDSGSRFVRKDLSDYLIQKNIQIRAVLCSHAHYDHTENLAYLQKNFGSELVLSAYDAGTLYDATALKSCFYSYTGRENEIYNGEMFCRADRVLVPGQSQVELDGTIFEILQLPGHAASHLGFVTPDGVAYLADSMFSADQLGDEKIYYMLRWSETLKTLEKVKKSQFRHYILAHYGVCDKIEDLAEKNLHQFRRSLDRFRNLCRKESTLEELVQELACVYHISINHYEKACIMERIARAMAEYLVEEEILSRRLRDGIPVYV